ncbi:glucose dehydrogenase [FAD, quinone]-like [Diabrotica undecimpunctata]|uniref:glucose dehydrogenase [FAD, quinone]-like n=1 Tax=Diabrotica undecimpunctata TaxID=50387 RepID=UPI003B6385F3
MGSVCKLGLWLLVIVVNSYGKQSLSKEKIISNYKRLIFNEGINAFSYEYHTDARMYKPDGNTLEEYEPYDFVIVGAGVTGCLLANRLSEISDWKILLLEAGDYGDNEIMPIPGLFGLKLLSDYNWGYVTTPQTHICLGMKDQKCTLPRGRGVGGTTLINSLQYTRANPENFNQWSKMLNDPSWSYENMLDYFKKSENFQWTNPEAPVDLSYHGTNGPLTVEHAVIHHPLTNLFLDANRDLGINITDYNSPSQIGASVTQLYTNKGRREDMGSIFVTPFLERRNLKVLTGSYVTKVVINKESKIAESVIFTKGGKTYNVRANKEIIISGGAITSPQILMLSGVGPKRHLEDVGVDVIQNLEVGSRFKEHALTGNLYFSSNLSTPIESIEDQLRDFLNNTGSLTSASTLSQSVGFYNLEKRDGHLPNVAMFIDTHQTSIFEQKILKWKDDYYETLSNIKLGNPFRFMILHMTTKSDGTIRLKSNDPFDYPLINPNLLTDQRDRTQVYRAIKFLFKMIETPTFKKFNLKFATPTLAACNHCKYNSKKCWECFMKELTMPGYHPMSSCPMGADPSKGAVVDNNLKVFGVNKLRVADASVFPGPISGYPSINCLVIGEKLADVIKKEYGVI